MIIVRALHTIGILNLGKYMVYNDFVCVVYIYINNAPRYDQIIPRHSKRPSYILQVSINRVKVFLYMVKFSIYIDVALKKLYTSS
jgi:hypothetical protein